MFNQQELCQKSELQILNTLKEGLKTIYGYNSFRDQQAQIMVKIIKEKKDLLILMPSGGGKSILFQLPAIVENKITLVVMPLISLIQDQVYQMRQLGIDVVDFTKKQDYQTVLQDSVKLIFVTPEKLSSDQELRNIIQQLFIQKKLNRVAVDEAHCISQWGSDFRKDYGQLGNLKNELKNIQIVALTATAPLEIKQEVIQSLNLNNNFETFSSSFNRPNLYYSVEKKDKVQVFQQMEYQIMTKHKNQSGIIYCSTRSKCEEVTKELKKKNMNVEFYHAGISEQKRKDLYLQWMTDQVQVLVATISLGMGINKPDIRFVLHYTPSQSIDAYYQESGRAGRDGLPSDCILYYSSADNSTQNFIIGQDQFLSDSQKQHKMKIFKQFVDYCENNTVCRRVMQLKYLGENFPQEKCNKKCDVCFLDVPQVEKQKQIKDKSQEALDILNYISAFSLRVKITKIQLKSALKGQTPSMKNTTIKNAIEGSKLQGYMKNSTVEVIEGFVNQMQTQGFFTEKPVKVGAYNVNYIFLNHEQHQKLINKQITFDFNNPTKSLAQKLQEGQKLAQISKSIKPVKSKAWNFKRKPEAEQDQSFKQSLVSKPSENMSKQQNQQKFNGNLPQFDSDSSGDMMENIKQDLKKLNPGPNKPIVSSGWNFKRKPEDKQEDLEIKKTISQNLNQQSQTNKNQNNIEVPMFDMNEGDQLQAMERDIYKKQLFDSQQQQRQEQEQLQKSQKEEENLQKQGLIMFNPESGYCTLHQFEIIDYQIKSIRIQEFLKIQKYNEFLTLESYMPKQFITKVCQFLPESLEEIRNLSKIKFETEILEQFLKCIQNFIKDQKITKKDFYIPKYLVQN